MKYLPNAVMSLACVGLVLFVVPGFLDVGQYQLIISVVGILLMICSVGVIAIMLSFFPNIGKPSTSRQTNRYNSARSHYDAE
ncbi:hypothetical protein [Shewanella colwelliana]|uniref:hypothetical protein n=1 Tax=Shewanella colwelliana TaxID=23 RepID=UPI0022AEBCDF|nr:hypothetical protein [Shewanella colwelliana]